MEDLAALAGVSKITVSRALRDSPLVTPATRSRIKALAEQVGYRMNFSARNLRLQRSHTIAVVLEMAPDADRPMSGPYPLHLLGGIMQELSTQGYNLLLTAVQAIEAGLPMAADGVILLGQGVHDAGVRAVADGRLPFVVWGAEHAAGRLAGAPAVVVGSDNRQGGASVARRFVELGRRAPLFLGDTRHAEVRERLLGFQAELKKASIKTATLRPEAFTFGAGHAAVQAHLRAAKATPDALFAASDLLAMGAVRACTEAGLAVPEDVSVVGYDDSPTAQTYTPPLSSVSQDWVHGGVLLARKVLDLIAGADVHSVTMPTRLVLRAT
ncbi:MAG: substrate-binding domain-containing protein [Burkholderiales bacterium]|nr:substrate-binding domain-containing protein [Burkholderiales bacterium]